jgi:hypothetical protein
MRVLAVVVVFAERAEELSLHARAHYPKGVGYGVAGNAGNAGTCAVEFELVFMPTKLFLKVVFDLLV